MARKNTDKVVFHQIKVLDAGAKGVSVAKAPDGKVVFIPNVVPGDVVDVQTFKKRKAYYEGKAVKLHVHSQHTTEPVCQHFGVCGGCQWQMLPYEKQLQYKQRQVSDNLQRIGKVTLPPLMPIIGATETKFYRNKVEYTFGTKEFTREKPSKIDPNDHQRFREPAPHLDTLVKIAGYHAKGFFDKIVDIETCYLLH